MGRKLLLFLSSAHCQASIWLNGELSATETFIDNADGQAKFAVFLNCHPGLTFLLTDLVEEDFRHESVPHLHGSERTTLLQRKLEHYYHNTPFRLATTIFRHKDGRHDDDILFSALTNPALITPWLNILLAQHIPLAGIYSVPSLSLPLVNDFSGACTLLLTWEKNAGLRQTYVDKNLLRFSRLTPIAEGVSLGATIAIEAARTRQYLRNLSLLPPDQLLAIALVCNAEDKAALVTQLLDDSSMHYTYLDIQLLANKLGAKAVCTGSDATPLFLQLLATQSPRNNYATTEHTHFRHLLQFRRSLYGLSAALGAASLLWTTVNVYESRTLDLESNNLRLQTQRLVQQTREIIQRVPGTEATATDMKTAVILSRKLEQLFPPPQIILEGLSKTLEDFSSIRMEQLSWLTSNEMPPVASSVQVNSTAMIAAQVISLSGQLSPFNGSYREALDQLANFRQALMMQGYSVTAMVLPVDISPQGSITADTCDGTLKPALFSLKIMWKMPT
jgi:hypothetical protein